MLARDVAPRAEISAIARVHPLDYIEAIRAATPKQGRTAIDQDTSMSPGTFEAALRSAGGAHLRGRRGDDAARSATPSSPRARPAITPKSRPRWASASSTTPPSPRATPRRPTAPSASRSSISTSITATARSTSSGTIRPSCTPRPTRCRTIPAPARSASAASTIRSSTRRCARATAGDAFREAMEVAILPRRRSVRARSHHHLGRLRRPPPRSARQSQPGRGGLSPGRRGD